MVWEDFLMQKWTPWIVGLFLLFVVYNQPDLAASLARNFGNFLGDLLRAWFQFLGSLFGGIDTTGASPTSHTLPGGNVADTVVRNGEIYYHSHPVPTTAP